MNRVDKLRQRFKDNEVDGMLITSASNRRYMARFTGTAGALLISEQEAVFITDFRYMDQAREQARGYDIVEHKGPIIDTIGEQIDRLGIHRLGFEADYTTYSDFRTYEETFSATLVPTSEVIEQLRLTKDEEELQVIRDAVKIADDAFEHIVDVIRPGMTELTVANELEFFMRKQGATSSSFDTIVASGYRSALPHGVASDKPIEKGELVTLDFGALYKGYCSDITRTVAIGEPSEELKSIYDIVLEAQKQGVAHLKAGMTCKEADALTRDVIEAKGYGEQFGHSTGHGIGLDVHEAPALSKRSERTLQSGMVVTVEPGIYVSGLGGVRIEDDVLLTENGNERLSQATKELVVID